MSILIRIQQAPGKNLGSYDLRVLFKEICRLKQGDLDAIVSTLDTTKMSAMEILAVIRYSTIRMSEGPARVFANKCYRALKALGENPDSLLRGIPLC